MENNSYKARTVLTKELIEKFFPEKEIFKVSRKQNGNYYKFVDHIKISKIEIIDAMKKADEMGCDYNITVILFLAFLDINEISDLWFDDIQSIEEQENNGN